MNRRPNARPLASRGKTGYTSCVMTFREQNPFARWRPRLARAEALLLLFSSMVAATFAVVATAQTTIATEILEKSGQGTETLFLLTRQGGRHRIKVELAATPEEQSRGLMFRTRLSARHGMLFLHDPPQKVVMWMKNTYLPLDIIFFDREGRVVQIVEQTTPLSLARIRSSQPVAAVLELPAGSVQSLSLGTGDRAEHRFFQR